jgi:hypothetical protein
LASINDFNCVPVIGVHVRLHHRFHCVLLLVRLKQLSLDVDVLMPPEGGDLLVSTLLCDCLRGHETFGARSEKKWKGLMLL